MKGIIIFLSISFFYSLALGIEPNKFICDEVGGNETIRVEYRVVERTKSFYYRRFPKGINSVERLLDREIRVRDIGNKKIKMEKTILGILLSVEDEKLMTLDHTTSYVTFVLPSVNLLVTQKEIFPEKFSSTIVETTVSSPSMNGSLQKSTYFSVSCVASVE